MKVKEQWIVEYNKILCLLVLTENNGYLLQTSAHLHNGFEFIANKTAQKLINYYD